MTNNVERDLTLDLIGELKKKPSLCVLTTFEFGLKFFDNYILKNLPEDTYLIIDRSKVDEVNNEPSNRFLSKMGNKIIFIDTPNGVFHPKMVLLLKDKKGCCYISSANLTKKGYMRNAEFVAKSYDNVVIAEAISFLINLLNNYGIGSASDKLLEKLKQITVSSDEINNEKNIKVVNNLEQPILSQINSFFNGKKIDEVYIISPYLDNSFMKLISKLRDITNGAKVTLVVQRNVNNYDQSIIGKNNIKLLAGGDEDRFLHSKIIYFKGENDYILSGSANFTSNALLKSSKDGNIELNTLITIPKGTFERYLHYLNFGEDNLNELKFKKLDVETNPAGYSSTFIYSSFVSGGKLTIEVSGKNLEEGYIEIYDINNGVPIKQIKCSDLKLIKRSGCISIELDIALDPKEYAVRIVTNEGASNKFYFTLEKHRAPPTADEFIEINYVNTELYELPPILVPYDVAYHELLSIINSDRAAKHYVKRLSRPDWWNKSSANKVVKGITRLFNKSVKELRNWRVIVEGSLDETDTSLVDESYLSSISNVLGWLIKYSVVDLKGIKHEEAIMILKDILDELSELQRIDFLFDKDDLAFWNTLFLYLYTRCLHKSYIRTDIMEEVLWKILKRYKYVYFDAKKLKEEINNHLSSALLKVLNDRHDFDDVEDVMEELIYIKNRYLETFINYPNSL